MERVHRDADLCKDIETEVIAFLEETNMKLDQLREKVWSKLMPYKVRLTGPTPAHVMHISLLMLHQIILLSPLLEATESLDQNAKMWGNVK